jgi:hypothetical protein
MPATENGRKKIKRGTKEKLVGRKDQPSEEEPSNVIVEIWLGTSGRKLSAISFPARLVFRHQPKMELSAISFI